MKKLKNVEEVTKILLSSSEEGFENSDENSYILFSSLDDIPSSLLTPSKNDDFIVLKVLGKQHYIGKLLMSQMNMMSIIYAKVDNIFYFPLEPDPAFVRQDDIELIFPLPKWKKQNVRLTSTHSQNKY